MCILRLFLIFATPARAANMVCLRSPAPLDAFFHTVHSNCSSQPDMPDKRPTRTRASLLCVCASLHLLLLRFYARMARINISPFTQVRVRMRRQQCCMDVEEVGEHRILRPNQQQRMAERTRARGWRGPEIPPHVMHVTKAKCAMIVSVGAHCVLPVGSRFKIHQ